MIIFIIISEQPACEPLCSGLLSVAPVDMDQHQLEVQRVYWAYSIVKEARQEFC